MADEEFVGEYEDYDYEADYDEEGGFDEEEVVDFEELGDAAMEGDEEAEDEFLGALAGIAAKALPAIKTLAPVVLPQVLKFGKKLLRGRSRRAVRAAPRVVRKAARAIRRRPRPYKRNPRRINMLLNRLIRQLMQQL